MLGCLLTYSLDRTKQIDRYRSISINHPNYVTIETSNSSSSSGGIKGSGGGSNGISSDSISIIIIEEGIPWLIELRNITFYFGRIENYDDFEAVKSSTKNHVWYKITYNCTQLAVQSSLYVDCVFTFSRDCFVDR